MYLLRFLSGSETGLQVPCNFSGGRAVFISRGGTPTSAVVLINEELSGLSQRTTSLWMEHEDGVWRVHAINFGPSRVAGKDCEQLWEAARQQRARGHVFNAAMLYAAAQSAAQRGTFYQARMMQDFNADHRSFVGPEIMRGAPPFNWTFGGETFHVSQIQYNGIASGEVALIIDHSPAAWTESSEADAINHRLIDGFIATYPEWSEIFDGVVARAARPGSNDTWGTVYTRSSGYSGRRSVDQPPGQ